MQSRPLAILTTSLAPLIWGSTYLLPNFCLKKHPTRDVNPPDFPVLQQRFHPFQNRIPIRQIKRITQFDKID